MVLPKFPGWEIRKEQTNLAGITWIIMTPIYLVKGNLMPNKLQTLATTVKVNTASYARALKPTIKVVLKDTAIGAVAALAVVGAVVIAASVIETTKNK